ncbi:MAG: efflux RND transporter periplasmic adaptor subunit [Hormoscilla sp. SP5CHS1]|nr:efflux RND transporter periplasmic adaptor subunit [Hormoscilla sp. SP5CHS1]
METSDVTHKEKVSVVEASRDTRELRRAGVSPASAENDAYGGKGKLSLARRLLWMVPLVAVVLGVGAIASHRLKNQPAQIEASAAATVAKLPVRAARAQIAPLQAWVFSDGFVEAVLRKHLTFEAEGTIVYVKKVNGRELRTGDFVRKGDLLAQVDPRKLASDVTVAQAQRQDAQQRLSTALASLRQSESAVSQAQAEKARAEASLASAQADLKRAEANRDFAQTDVNRYQKLWEDGVVSKSEWDTRETQFAEAQAAVEAARAQVKAADAGIRAASSAVSSAQAAVLSQQAQVESAQSGIKSAIASLNKTQVILEDTEIVAPFDSIIAHLNIKEGDYWTPQRINATGDYQQIVESVPIIAIDPNEFEVDVELPAFDGARVRTGQRAFIIANERLHSPEAMTSADLIDLASAEGIVFSVSPSVTPGGRAIEVKIRVNKGTQNLKNGARVSAWIAVEEKLNATTAPFNAFVWRDQKPHVFVVNQQEKIVEQRQIKTGIRGISQREIIDGVQPGELLVTEGKNSLVDGAPVEVIE